MSIAFFKYHGTGNDFIMIDDRDMALGSDFINQIPRLCHRHFGIGADGVILIRNHADYDFEMVYFNPDGSQSLCGNGSRCAVAFAKYLGMISGLETRFLAFDGPHYAKIDGEVIHLSMADNDNLRSLREDFFANTGSPHFVRVVRDLDTCPVVPEGRKIRYDDQFGAGGTNVNFISIDKEKNTLEIRTYERGVEDETWSCGTGITAASLAASRLGLKSPVDILAKGGRLSVSFDTDDSGCFKNIFLIGPAKFVFSGTISPESL
jgi:diaminopimelate epimerase